MSELQQLHDAILEVSDPLSIMRRVVEEALVLIPSGDGATVELIQDVTLTYVCAAGNLAAHVGTVLHVDQSLSGLAAKLRETLRCDDANVDPRVDREVCLRLGTISMICVPMLRGENPIGVLKLSATRPNAFSEEAVEILAALAGFVSTAVTAATDLAAATVSVLARQVIDEPVLALPRLPRSAREDRIGRFVANVLQPGVASATALRGRVERMLERDAFTIVAQPIVELSGRRAVGVEALARFDGPPSRSASVWFEEARRAGLSREIELACARAAFELLDRLPPDLFVSVNLGPDGLMASETLDLLERVDTSRVVLELTEHLQVQADPVLLHAIDQIRSTGARLAIDDTGAGFSTLDNILSFAPEIIKLDQTITHGIDTHPARRALARALMSFAAEIDATVIAEGIEAPGELDAVEGTGIAWGQGFLLGHPEPMPAPPARTRTPMHRPYEAA